MKKSIKWHKECLKNMSRHAVEKRKCASLAAYESAKAEVDVVFLTAQIAQAEKLGKDGFDSEKFMAKFDGTKELQKMWTNRPQT